MLRRMIKPETTHNKTKERNDEQMQKLKTEKGITLIALVITIIVMLILVGVSVTVALNGGLFTTAKEAAEGTATKRNEELELSSGKVTINGEEYNSIDEYVNGGSSNNPEEPTGYTAYTIGQEVTVGGENFYVLKESDETQEKVTLLAKDNIDTTTLVQSTSANTVAFSNTDYWSGIEGKTYPYDLIETGEPDESHNAAKVAYDYGMKLGGTGRLLIYSEARALATANSDILYGRNGKSSGTCLNFWLGSTDDTNFVYLIYGADSTFYSTYSFTSSSDYGVRPVVEISKDKIS